jgi:hypothetical protein
MGAEYKSVDEFARKAKAAFGKIRGVYPGLKLDHAKGVLILRPSPTAAPLCDREHYNIKDSSQGASFFSISQTTRRSDANGRPKYVTAFSFLVGGPTLRTRGQQGEWLIVGRLHLEVCRERENPWNVLPRLRPNSGG